MENFKEYKDKKAEELKNLSEQMESVMNEMAGYLDQMYEEGGLEVFGDLDYPEYYGVALLTIPTPDGWGVGYYYIPEGYDGYQGDIDNRGSWISSSQTCN